MHHILIAGGSLVTPRGLERADVLISPTGAVESVTPHVRDRRKATVIDATDRWLLPLLIDCHVHFREPGLTHKGTMLTESASALVGGVGCVCDMPNTMPPTVSLEALAEKVQRAEAVDTVMMRFFFGVTDASHLAALRELWSGTSLQSKRLKRHCAGLKLFLDHSTGDQKVDGGIVDEIFRTCGELQIPLVAHCEDAAMNAACLARMAAEPRHIALHSAHRPPASEAASIADAIGFAKKHGTHLHIAHLSTASGLMHVRQAKIDGVAVTCEVAPHHLFLTTDDYASLGALGKMNPPLRSQQDRDALWAGIADGTVDCVATDHAPHTLEEKRTNYPLSAPSGVPGVATMLPLLLSAAAGACLHPTSTPPQNLRLGAADILRLCFDAPNRIFSLHQSPIHEKEPARIAIVDPQATWTITAEALRAKCGWTPYEGWQCTGKVTTRVTDTTVTTSDASA